MKKIILIASILINLSCTHDNELLITDKKEINNFGSWTEFVDEYSRYANSMTDYSDKLKNIIKSDETLLKISPALAELFSESKQFIVNDTLYSFFKGNIYESAVKSNPKQRKITSKIIISTKLNKQDINVNLNNQTTSSIFRMNLGHNQIDARHQFEFFRQSHSGCDQVANLNPSPRKYKYVHEIFSESINAGFVQTNLLYLRIKLEWNPSSNRWRQASERRNININIVDNSYLVGSNNAIVFAHSPINRPATIPVSINQNFSCSQDQTILLRQFNITQSWTQYSVSITGEITHHINGDTWSNRWVNSSYWPSL